MSEKRYYLQINFDILNFIYLSEDGARISNITQKCNLATIQAQSYLKTLCEKRFIKRKLNKKYYILEEGRNLLSYLLMMELLKSKIKGCLTK